MKQVMFKRGRGIIEEMPTPIAGPGEVLVQVHYSCISAGTEMSGMKASSKPVPLYRKALRQPERVKKALDMIRTKGIAATVAKLTRMQKTEKDRSELGMPTGYSAAGTILEVGEEIEDLKVGDRVACAGAGIANHAEFIAVPRNLVVKLPEAVPFDLASTVTLGAIAMQGVRRAEPEIGHIVAVVGLGILGQMAVQMLKVGGCRVVGIDLDASRIERAKGLGMDAGINPAATDAVRVVTRFAGGYGVDSVILTAASESSALINDAMAMCRRKGRVVIVGAVGLDLSRHDFYAKELDVLISTSYGPGRYDDSYELQGQDYPYAYVRWTENRNMESYLRLIGDGRLDIRPLIDKIYPINDAPQAYADFGGEGNKPLIALLQYEEDVRRENRVVVADRLPVRGKLNVALVGVGAFIKGTHLPNLAVLTEQFSIRAIVDKIGSNAKAEANRHGASYATTNIGEVLKDEDVNVVIIGTRHNLHAQFAVEAARAGKAVFLEKPMAMNAEELDQLTCVLEETKVPFMVGFNRRFSPYAVKIKKLVTDRTNPMIINYRTNAGFIPREHWVHTPEGGGRNIGEACHIYDLFNFLTDAQVNHVYASAITPKTAQVGRNDNFVATIEYTDGSVANLIYTGQGHGDAPKEQMDVYCDNTILCLNDYRELTAFGRNIIGGAVRGSDKGHRAELVAFAKSIQEGDGYPIPLWQLVQATQVSFAVDQQLGA